MQKARIRILVTSVALCALMVASDALAAGHGGGGGGGGFHGGGGGGFHGMGGGGIRSFGGGGGFHGLAVHGGGIPSLSVHGLSAHGLSAGGITHAFGHHGFALGHNFAFGHYGRAFGHHGFGSLAHYHYAGHRITSHAGRFAVQHGGRNAVAAHNALSRVGAHPTARSLTHNQFAAEHFHGLHDFDRAGFNRNRFGHEHEWNRWGHRFWAAGWNNWGWGWGGWAGPVFWPFLYGDIFTFALWPYDYYDPFWAYGPDFLLASIFAPGPYFGPELGYEPDYYEGFPDFIYAYPAVGNGAYPGGQHLAKAPTHAEREALAETNSAAVESCGGLAPDVTSLPIDQIRGTIHPTADQDAALDALSSASAKANEVIKASCPAETPLTPVGRLDAVQKRLDGMIQAVQLISSQLADFYDSLNDEQKKRFDEMGGSGRPALTSGELTALCRPQSGEVAQLPIQRIEQLVHPNAQQQGDFDDLKSASQNAANALLTSCPTQMPGTPVGRLEAVRVRLTAMIDALQTIRPKLQAFYSSLTDEQKAKFNALGPAPQSANPQSQSSG